MSELFECRLAITDVTREQVDGAFARMLDRFEGKWAARDDEEAALLRVISRSADKEGPREVYADWLEEHGDKKRAAAVRALATFDGLDDEAVAELRERVGGPFLRAVAAGELTREDDVARSEGEYAVGRFCVQVHRHPAGCWFSVDLARLPSAIGDEALRCLNLWAEELGTTVIDADEWSARFEALGDDDPADAEVPLGFVEDDEDDEDDDAGRMRGPASRTVVLMRTLEDTEVKRLEVALGTRELPEGFRTDPERMRANVRSIVFVDFDARGVEYSFSTIHFDQYGREVARSGIVAPK